MEQARTDLMLKLFSERNMKMGSQLRLRARSYLTNKGVFSEQRKSQTPMAARSNKLNRDLIRMYNELKQQQNPAPRIVEP